MSENVTDEDVEQARKRVDSLREQVNTERQKRAANAKSSENALRKSRLDAEAEKFEAELKALREKAEPQKVAPTPTPAPASTPQARTGSETARESASKAENDKE